MISLALFGLIALAGLALVDSVLGIEQRTGKRLDRLADLQRAMFVMTSDLEQIAAAPLTGSADSIAFSRPVAAAAGVPAAIRYGLAGGTVGRTVTVPGGPSGTQTMLPGVAALRFRYWTAAGGWTDRWPPDPKLAATWPTAVAADITLAPGTPGPGGTLTRIVPLPVHP
jgi:general secretion pathway protein J